MATFQLGTSEDEMVDVLVEWDPNQRGEMRARTITYNVAGATLQQYGQVSRSWVGRLYADSLEEVRQLENLYRSRAIYFNDNTPGGTGGGPVLVLWQGEFTPDFEQPELATAQIPFQFETIASVAT